MNLVKRLLFLTTILATSIVLADGRSIYNQSCFVCHGMGLGDAPKLGDSEAWDFRIVQGINTLYDHAIYGSERYDDEKGKHVSMPAKGGFTSLSDDDVKAAVDYMVDAATNNTSP